MHIRVPLKDICLVKAGFRYSLGKNRKICCAKISEISNLFANFHNEITCLFVCMYIFYCHFFKNRFPNALSTLVFKACKNYNFYQDFCLLFVDQMDICRFLEFLDNKIELGVST